MALNAGRGQNLGGVVDDGCGGRALVEEGQPEGHDEGLALAALEHRRDVCQHSPEGDPEANCVPLCMHTAC